MRVGLVLATAVLTARAESEGSDCRALGFAPSLLCSSCTKLGEHIGADDPLLAECGKCCNEDAELSSTFARATLDVCR